MPSGDFFANFLVRVNYVQYVVMKVKRVSRMCVITNERKPLKFSKRGDLSNSFSIWRGGSLLVEMSCSKANLRFSLKGTRTEEKFKYRCVRKSSSGSCALRGEKHQSTMSCETWSKLGGSHCRVRKQNAKLALTKI
ncbi:hypothetical protein L6452_33079 [Arctium lappa]|uniref:Uncharacterized protein n=1 Tax=Arctium lappa TaxID=4217 RepID=A0ACB8Z5G0_ARCLA|nr:hypothetical protein L6452_33079 [Arctium lappa]